MRQLSLRRASAEACTLWKRSIQFAAASAACATTTCRGCTWVWICSLESSNTLCGAQLGHQAVNCTNGTINWRQIYGDEAFRLKPAIFPSDVDRAKKEKEIDVEALERQARKYARVSPRPESLAKKCTETEREALLTKNLLHLFSKCTSPKRFPLSHCASGSLGLRSAADVRVGWSFASACPQLHVLISCLAADLTSPCVSACAERHVFR